MDTPTNTRENLHDILDNFDTAMMIVTTEGIDALTMARLASELDAAIGAVYRYFPSKGALVAQIQGQAIELLSESYAVARDRSDRRFLALGLDSSELATPIRRRNDVEHRERGLVLLRKRKRVLQRLLRALGEVDGHENVFQLERRLHRRARRGVHQWLVAAVEFERHFTGVVGGSGFHGNPLMLSVSFIAMRRLQRCRTTSTGHGAWRTTRSVVLPNSACFKPV